MKKITLAMMLLFAMFIFTACGSPAPAAEETETDPTSNASKVTEEFEGGGGQADTETPAEPVADYTVAIEIADFGTITVALDGTAAPVTVQNFVDLVNEGFYDGLTFHRVMTGFMIQGGDPAGNGTGGSEVTIRGEFAANGVENNLKHTRGAISMARSSAPDSASSQFFIVHEDSDFLDGNYAVFGYVTEGIEVVDAICTAMTALGYDEAVAAADQPVITSIRIVE